MLRLSSFIFNCIFIVNTAFSQVFSTGAEKINLNWCLYDRGNIRYIYPQVFENKISSLIPYTDSIYPLVFKRFTEKNIKIKIPLVFHAFSSTSNGMTLLGPRRVELYAFQESEPYSQPWLEQLTLHELRHAAQLIQMNHGFTKGVGFLTGEQGIAALFGIFIPRWYFEGDAVWAETMFSSAGRGRHPEFNNQFYAFVKENKHSFDRAMLGSYKYFIPDNYVIGYHMVNEINRLSGYDAAPDIIKKTACSAYMPNTFNRSLRVSTGKSKKQIYKLLVDSLFMKKKWSSSSAKNLFPFIKEYRISKRNEFDSTEINKVRNGGGSENSKANGMQRGGVMKNEALTSVKCKLFENMSSESTYTSYYSPCWINDSEIVVLRTNLTEPSAVVKITLSGKQQRLFFLESPDAHLIHSANNKIIYTQKAQDRRWEHVSYSNIWMFDMITNQKIKITNDGYFQSPRLSDDAEVIATVEYFPDGHNELVLINTITRKKTSIYVSDLNEQIITPSFSPDNNSIIAIILNSKGKNIRIFKEIHSSEVSVFDIFDKPTFNEIRRPVFADNDRIFFSYSFNKKEEICEINLKLNNVIKISSSDYGSFSPNFNNKSLCFSTYTPFGFRISVLHKDSLNNSGEVDTIDLELNQKKVFSDISKKSFDSSSTHLISKKFNPFFRSFNFHSYAPFFYNSDFSSASSGALLMSQDLLGTSLFRAGYVHYPSLNKNTWLLEYDYKGLPFEIGVEAQKSSFLFLPENENNKYQKDENITSFHLSFPLNFSEGLFYRKVLFSIIHSYQQNINHYVKKETCIFPITYRFAFGLYRNKAHRDIESPLVIRAELLFKHTPIGENDAGSLLYFNISNNFPGFFKNHIFKSTFDADFLKKRKFIFSNIASIPIGFTNLKYISNQHFRSEYVLPLFYPDFSMGGLLYIKRFRTSIFYDCNFIFLNEGRRFIDSEGIDLLGDVHIFRIIFPLEIGIRAQYSNNLKKWHPQLLFKLLFTL